jgi:CHAD domain-containing protein
VPANGARSATLAAGAVTVAVGASVALARAARARRTAASAGGGVGVGGWGVKAAGKGAARRFALAPGEELAQGLRRIALEQLELALELLQGESGLEPGRAVHETRKALKRLRALMRLLREEMGEQGYARENALLRDAGRQLAGARDAEVMRSTLDGLLRERPKLARRAGVQRLRAQFEREREQAAARSFEDATVRAQVAGELRALELRVALWKLPEREGIKLAQAGLGRIYRQGRRRLGAARKDGSAASMHEWRKRVKDLRYAAEMLERRGGREYLSGTIAAAIEAGLAGVGLAGVGLAGVSAKGRRRRKELEQRQRSIRRTAKRADELGELLGEEHDLAVLTERVRASPALAGKAKTRRALLKEIKRRRKKLRKRALKLGERLYREQPGRFTRRVARAYARAQR